MFIVSFFLFLCSILLLNDQVCGKHLFFRKELILQRQATFDLGHISDIEAADYYSPTFLKKKEIQKRFLNYKLQKRDEAAQTLS